MTKSKSGSLICVGTGILLGAHLTPIARKSIESADVVFMAMSSHLMEEWVSGLNPQARSLQFFYKEGVSRLETYRSMVDLVTQTVREGKQVCLALYGHPGVFALVAHRCIEVLSDEGFATHMEPAISAEDCLFADLGIDPATYGCIQYESTQFILYDRPIDTSAYLILWQVGVAGDLSLSRFTSSREGIQLLLETLLDFYPVDHLVTVYEARTIANGAVRKEKVQLGALTECSLSDISTLVVPPVCAPRKNQQRAHRLSKISKRLIS